jgi:predicted PurR-regulated permease PerM
MPAIRAPEHYDLALGEAVSASLQGPACREGGGMSLASSSYPMAGVFWSVIYFFLWIIWIWILIWIFIDIFRSRDLSGWAKALWFLFILFIPLIGVLVYLIVRGGSMQRRTVQEAQQEDQAAQQYIREAAGTSGPSGTQSSVDQLAKLADLRERGVISADEFEREKAKILAG